MNGSLLHAEVSGNGPDVVLVHGIPGSPASWSAVAADLAPDHRVTVPALLGFGPSPRPTGAADLAPDSQAQALAAKLDALGIGSAVVAGHDFGGPVALHLAAARPDLVRGVLLAATNAFGDTPVPFPLSAVRWPLVGGAAGRLLFSRPSLRMMLRQGTGAGSRGPEAAAALGDAAQRRAIASIFGASLRHLADRYAPVERALRGLDVPVAVVWGSADPFFPVEQAHRTAAAAPGRVTARILDGAGHFLPDERPRELAEAIRTLARAALPAAA